MWAYVGLCGSMWVHVGGFTDFIPLQVVCEHCQGLGWSRDSEHLCAGHEPCRNHTVSCQRRIAEPEPSLWRELEALDRRGLRDRQPELLVTVVQARNLPVRDTWRAAACYGTDPSSAAKRAFLGDRSVAKFVDRYESCNASCTVSLYAEHGRVAPLGETSETGQVRASSYPIFNSCFTFPLGPSRSASVRDDYEQEDFAGVGSVAGVGGAGVGRGEGGSGRGGGVGSVVGNVAVSGGGGEGLDSAGGGNRGSGGGGSPAAVSGDRDLRRAGDGYEEDASGDDEGGDATVTGQIVFSHEDDANGGSVVFVSPPVRMPKSLIKEPISLKSEMLTYANLSRWRTGLWRLGVCLSSGGSFVYRDSGPRAIRGKTW